MPTYEFVAELTKDERENAILEDLPTDSMAGEVNDGRTDPDVAAEQAEERVRIVECGDCRLAIPVADDPLVALRESFDGVDRSVLELREDAREYAIESAGN